ncbi:T9SS type B sorting domain-containing protein [Mariniflexile sp.]|uniref:T9SS type B sorting domain-containing protein n=1 Tax=Mariniflexile sp. TaxID=1979402 RepID=UPI00356367DE
MIQRIFTILILGLGLFCYGQKEASNWYFGDNAGIQFNADGSVTELTDGQLNTIEGCTTISDENGDLLFYTDGLTVYNKNHEMMINGYGLFGDPSSTQSAIVVPKPKDPNIYYIFTVDTEVANNDTDLGFNYSIVDLTQDGGLGSVMVKNINLLPDSSEKVTAVVKDCISESIWVITFAPNNSNGTHNTFFSYEVTATGLNTTPVTSTFTTNATDARGYLKLSPDGTKLVCSNSSSGLFLYDFDKTTGKVSNEKPIKINFSNNGTKPQYSYGVEFSQNNKLLYVTTYYQITRDEDNFPTNQYGALLQYNITAPDISASEVVLDHRVTYRGGLQLGPNGKIYRSMNASYEQGLPYLSVINAPNNIGTACNYTHNSFALSNNARQGLPPFITSFFSEKIDIIRNSSTIESTELILCEGDSYTLKAEEIPGASYTWSRNDVLLSNSVNELEITEDGFYKVFIDPNTGDCDNTLEGVAYVSYKENPIAYDYTLTQCDEDGIVGGFTRFNLTEANDGLTGNVPGLSVKFFRDISLTDEITDSTSYSFNANNPKPVYAKVYDNVTECYDTSVLSLNVTTSLFEDFTPTPLCDELDSEDGINTFNLDDIASEIQVTYTTLLSVSFYKTFDDAILEQNKLGATFINTTPYSQLIYARIESDNSCFGIKNVYLKVNKLPDIEPETENLYCLNRYPETIIIDSGIQNEPISNYSYRWSTGETSHNIQINQIGIYTVEITNANGCSKSRTITVNPSNIATIEAINIEDVTTKNNTITVLVTGEGTYEYALYDEFNIQIRAFQEDNYFDNVKPGIYNVNVKDVKNDCGITTEAVSVIGFPKFFTPNGDGFNDTWQVYGVSSMFQPNTKILIFNRFGKLIKELSPLAEGWNGRINGELVPTDDYWFTVQLQDGRLFKNHFTLKR